MSLKVTPKLTIIKLCWDVFILFFTLGSFKSIFWLKYPEDNIFPKTLGLLIDFGSSEVFVKTKFLLEESCCGVIESSSLSNTNWKNKSLLVGAFLSCSIVVPDFTNVNTIESTKLNLYDSYEGWTTTLLIWSYLKSPSLFKWSNSLINNKEVLLVFEMLPYE